MNSKKLATYNVLSSEEQQILQALSVIYVPVGQIEFQSILKKSATFPPSSIAKIDKLFKETRETLEKAEIIVTSSNNWQCHPDSVEQLTRLAVQQPWFDKLADFLIANNKIYYQDRLVFAHTKKILRLFLYQGNEKDFTNNFRELCALFPQSAPPAIERIFFDEFDADWFASLPQRIKFEVLSYFVSGNLNHLGDENLQYQ
ncbi:MAG: hypothetical protein Q7U38_09905, partial [Methylobacter sp.]|nr:hypothetical protein [Methylobacter sp.]